MGEVFRANLICLLVAESCIGLEGNTENVWFALPADCGVLARMGWSVEREEEKRVHGEEGWPGSGVDVADLESRIEGRCDRRGCGGGAQEPEVRWRGSGSRCRRVWLGGTLWRCWRRRSCLEAEVEARVLGLTHERRGWLL